jgi:hypothetical protein
VQFWPNVEIAEQAQREARELAAIFGTQLDEPASGADLVACVTAVRSFAAIDYSDPRRPLVHRRGPLAEGRLTWPEEYARATSDLARSTVTLIASVGRALPRTMGVGGEE